MTWAIEAHALTKQYPLESGWRAFFRRQLAAPVVDRVDLHVRQGELFGLVGPNGAGKTTLIKMLATLILPTSGAARICGHPLQAERAIKRCVGLVTSDERSFYWRLSGRQNLEFFAALQGLSAQAARLRAGEVLALVDLLPQADQRFQTYSTGMRQRLSIARALLVEPQVLFLDEPTRGLDPPAQEQLLSLLREKLTRQHKMTIFLTSHNLNEVERICDRVAILQSGRIRAVGSIAELRQQLGASRQYDLALAGLPAAIESALRQFTTDYHLTPADHPAFHLQIAGLAPGGLDPLIDRLRAAGVSILAIHAQELSLEQIFSRVTLEGPGAVPPTGYAPGPSEPGLPWAGRDRFAAGHFVRIALAFLRRDLQMEISYRFSFFLQFFSILFSVAVFYFIAELLGDSAAPYLQAYGGDYFAFVLIGIAFSGYFGVGLSGFSNSLRTAQTTGTLEAMLGTPTSLSAIILSSSQWSYLMTTLQVVVYLLVGVLLLGVSLASSNLGVALLVLLLTVITFSSLGILAASFIMILKRGDPITWLFGTFSSLLGGVYYPLEIMPGWMQALANLLPITYALRAMRLALLQGASLAELGVDLAILAGFSLLLLPLSLLSFRYAVRRARQDGSLTHY